MVWMSSVRVRTGKPAHRRARSFFAGSPSRMRHTSVLVPPMSNVIRFGTPSCSPSPTLPMTPPAGPEKKVLTGVSAHRARRDRAAVRLHDARRAAYAERRHAALEALEIAVHDRHQARVDGRGGEALELAELRPARRWTCTGTLPARASSRARERAPRARGWRRHAGSRSRPPRPASHLQRRRRALALSSSDERRDFRAVVRDAARDLEAAIARRGRHRLRNVEVEVMRPALARELQHVAKPGGREHARCAPTCLRARRWSRASCRARETRPRRAELREIEHLGDAVEYGARRIGGDRGHLVIRVAAARELDRTRSVNVPPVSMPIQTFFFRGCQPEKGVDGGACRPAPRKL